VARGVAPRDLDKHRCTPLKWLWHGYLGPGKVTLLTSQWKSGKATLLAGLPGQRLCTSEQGSAGRC
jgi:hypothetical protein